VIKRVEINYRGVFQKNLGKYIGRDIVSIASSEGKVAFSNGRYSDAPERNGIPCKYFAFVSPDLEEVELEGECGAKLDIDEADVSLVVDDAMVKGVEPWANHGVRPINEKVQEKGCLLVVTRHDPEKLLEFTAKRPFTYRLATIEGDSSLAGLWVDKDDLTRERCLGGIAAVDPGIISIKGVETYLRNEKNTKILGPDARKSTAYTGEERAKAAREAYEATLRRVSLVTPEHGIEWPHEVPVLPKWHEFEEGSVIPAIPRGFEKGPRGQTRNDAFKRGTTKTERPVVRFDLCIKCTLCWLDCPDECFDPTDDGLYDVNYEVCVGCHKCADVCPVPECIVMVDELQFNDDKSPWVDYKKDPHNYFEWAEDKKGDERIHYNHVTGTGKEITKFEKSQRVPEKVAGK
jgi:pyruvate ferredoxin oxidoreductase delta subunit